MIAMSHLRSRDIKTSAEKKGLESVGPSVVERALMEMVVEEHATKCILTHWKTSIVTDAHRLVSRKSALEID